MLAKFSEGRWRVVRGKEVQKFAVPAIDDSKLGVADANSVLEHRVEYRLQIAGRAGNDLEHLGGRRLLLQRLSKFSRALLLRLEQPGILDRDQRLVTERFGLGDFSGPESIGSFS